MLALPALWAAWELNHALHGLVCQLYSATRAEVHGGPNWAVCSGANGGAVELGIDFTKELSIAKGAIAFYVRFFLARGMDGPSSSLILEH